MSERTEILRTLVGSRAYGLATDDSDWDYRSVYITPTSELLKLGVGAYKGTHWTEGEKEDDTAYEVGHFLYLATKSNPSILEVFKAPVIYPEQISQEECDLATKQRRFLIKPSLEIAGGLLSCFRHAWSSKGVFEAFKGYSHNQHVKLFSEKEEFAKRKFKYAIAHLRVLLEGIELLSCNDFSVKVRDYYLGSGFGEKNGLHLHLPYWAVNELGHNRAVKEGLEESWAEYLLAIKRQEIQVGNIIDTAEYLKLELQKAYEANPDKQTNLGPINEFLLQVRKEIW